MAPAALSNSSSGLGVNGTLLAVGAAESMPVSLMHPGRITGAAGRVGGVGGTAIGAILERPATSPRDFVDRHAGS